MRSVKWLTVVCAALVLVLAIGGASAQTNELDIDDGRINYWQVAAPAAIYCKFDHPDVTDPDKSEFAGVEILSIDKLTGNGELALWADADLIDSVEATPEVNTLIAEDNGYRLYRATNGGFFTVGPEGYVFDWERGDLFC